MKKILSRRAEEETHRTDLPSSPDSNEGAIDDHVTPRWVKISGIIAIVLILLVVGTILLSGGNHGPGRHLSPEGIGSGTLPIVYGGHKL